MHIAHINNEKEQTVENHCKNVGSLCEFFGTKIGLGQTAKLAGILHDLGKDKDEFEKYLRYTIMHPEDRSLKGKINHSSAGARYIFDNFSKGDILQKITAQMIALAICSHHGGLSDIVSPDGFDEISKKIYPDKDVFYDECIKNFTAITTEMPQIKEQFYKSKNEITEIINRMKKEEMFNRFSVHLLVKFLFSCLIDADRLDTCIFMENKLGVDLSNQTDNANMDDLWRDFLHQLEDRISVFSKDTKVDLLRREISDACKEFASHSPGIYQLSVPTGGGKTLSSLRYALEHAHNFKKDRIFYIIPFTTIIDQNAKVIKDILKRDKLILEHHSNLVLDNDYEDYKLLTERWVSPIILTTMVQFLDTIFSGGTQNIRRMHSLANSIIIFDEIQSIPVKCIHLLNSALNFLSRLCNTTIILCTATQPLLNETPRPLKLSFPADIIQNIHEKFQEFKRVEVKNRCINGGYNCFELAEFVMERMENVKNTLVILNTRKSAKDLFLQLKRINDLLPEGKKFKIYHLSTNMCPKHRIEVIESIKERLSNERLICVSTQLIEAGVDISFECVIRAIAGLDNIAQAAGRCNRHGEKACCNVYIINIKDEGLSNLPDIKEAQACTVKVLEEFKEKPESIEYDLLSPKALKRYFYYYFNAVNDKMDYRVKKENTNLFELLSLNQKGIDAYFNRTGQNIVYPLTQAFETASKYFQVIDENTIGIIVPYGEGKRLISEINGNCNIKQLRGYLKEAQKFSVNLFEHEYKKISNVIYQLKNAGILALREEFYDDYLGVVTDGSPMKTLLI